MLIESLLAQKEALPLLLWLLKEEDHYKGGNVSLVRELRGTSHWDFE